ncbi:MAG: amidohydrolase, partial [Colwelliaceae bacterium]|nr:amidohydrolase [Colwelliaceae bacterium]
MNKSNTFITALALYSFSTLLSAQTTLIKNIQGYTIENNELIKFKAIQFTDDKIDKTFESDVSLPKNNQ